MRLLVVVALALAACNRPAVETVSRADRCAKDKDEWIAAAKESVDDAVKSARTDNQRAMIQKRGDDELAEGRDRFMAVCTALPDADMPCIDAIRARKADPSCANAFRDLYGPLLKLNFVKASSSAK